MYSHKHAYSGRLGWKQSAAKVIAQIGALICVMLGAAVIIGWTTHNVNLIQVLPELVPMQFNTALGFILIGLGLLFFTLKKNYVGGIFAAIALLLGLLTFLQYIFSINLGIDQLFMRHYILVQTSDPGRMAPNTALCFTLAGVSLCWMWLRQLHERNAFVMVLMSFIITMLGATAFFGYLINFSVMYRWGMLTNMAWHTSLGFLIWGIASLAAILQQIKASGTAIRFMPPLMVFIAGMLIYVVIWQLLVSNESKSLKSSLNSVAHSIVSKMAIKMQDDFKAIERMTDRWVLQQAANKTVWQYGVQNYLRDHPGIDAVGWLDDNNKLQLYLTHQQQQANISQDVIKQAVQDVVALAPNRAVMMVKHLSKIETKPTLLLAIIPTATGPTQRGHMVGIYVVKQYMQELLQSVALDQYQISIYVNGILIYTSNHDQDAYFAKHWLVQSAFNQSGMHWQLSIAPTEQLVREYRSVFPETILIIGLIFSSLLAVLIYFMQSLKASRQLLELSNRDLESFSYSVSHDLRAPLRHMSGFVNLLKKNEATHLNDASQRYVDIIAESTERMGRLIDGLLLLSQINCRELKKSNFSLQKMLRDVIDELSHEYQGRQIEWQIDGLPSIFADQDSFRLVVQNLIANAIKFTRHESLAIIRVAAEDIGDYMLISVNDNGVGFKQKQSDQVFGIFQRLHKEGDFEGTGIGLANVEMIVRRHQGQVWADAEPGKGSTFYVMIPKLKISRRRS